MDGTNFLWTSSTLNTSKRVPLVFSGAHLEEDEK
jgi:hypothetical protein